MSHLHINAMFFVFFLHKTTGYIYKEKRRLDWELSLIKANRDDSNREIRNPWDSWGCKMRWWDLKAQKGRISESTIKRVMSSRGKTFQLFIADNKHTMSAVLYVLFVIWWTEKCEWMVSLDLFSSPPWREADMSGRTDRDVCCCGGVQVQVCHWGFNLHTVCAPACQRVHLHVWYLHVNLCEDKLFFKVKSEDIIKRQFLTQRIIWDCVSTSCVRT